MPIFDYRCAGGHRFERLVHDPGATPECPECAEPARKVPSAPSLRRAPVGRTSSDRPAAAGGGQVPIPWRGTVAGGAEAVQREVTFRDRLEAKARSGLRTPGAPDSRPGRAGGRSPDGPVPSS